MISAESSISETPRLARYLGIDPGLNRTGYAVLERGTSGPILREGGVIRSTRGLSLAEREHEIGSGLREALREELLMFGWNRAIPFRSEQQHRLLNLSERRAQVDVPYDGRPRSDRCHGNAPRIVGEKPPARCVDGRKPDMVIEALDQLS